MTLVGRARSRKSARRIFAVVTLARRSQSQLGRRTRPATRPWMVVPHVGWPKGLAHAPFPSTCSGSDLSGARLFPAAPGPVRQFSSFPLSLPATPHRCSSSPQTLSISVRLMKHWCFFPRIVFLVGAHPDAQFTSRSCPLVSLSRVSSGQILLALACRVTLLTRL